MTVRGLLLITACLFSCLSAQRGAYRSLVQPQVVHELPALPFGYDDLEPLVDAATLKVHHLGHHRAYCNKTNAAFQQWRAHDTNSDSLAHKSLVEVLQHLSEVPDQWRTNLRNNGGGFLNHIFYWETMCPSPQATEPSGKLANDIVKTFGSFEQFKTEFTRAGKQLFGSGYVWLSWNTTGFLTISSTQNQDCPLTSGLYPVLVLDVWEHAYYLQHQNKRADYISAWWEVVCWNYVAEIFLFWQDYLNNHTPSPSPHQEL